MWRRQQQQMAFETLLFAKERLEHFWISFQPSQSNFHFHEFETFLENEGGLLPSLNLGQAAALNTCISTLGIPTYTTS